MPSQRAKKIVGYGAPGKGNTLLNYCGIRTDFSTSPPTPNPIQARQIHSRYADSDRRTGDDSHARPDYVLILPWNLRDEITSRLRTYVSGAASSWCRFRKSASYDRGAGSHSRARYGCLSWRSVARPRPVVRSWSVHTATTSRLAAAANRA